MWFSLEFPATPITHHHYDQTQYSFLYSVTDVTSLFWNFFIHSRLNSKLSTKYTPFFYFWLPRHIHRVQLTINPYYQIYCNPYSRVFILDSYTKSEDRCLLPREPFSPFFLSDPGPSPLGLPNSGYSRWVLHFSMVIIVPLTNEKNGKYIRNVLSCLCQK